MHAWNNWYHVNGNTYGTWLPGDPRGWRSRHHRRHVEGDYRAPPPPGTDDGLREHCENAMPRDAVHLNRHARRLACSEMLASLQRHRVKVVAVSVDDHHFHILARFVPMDAETPRSVTTSIRKLVGIAKKDSARALSNRDLVRSGGLWAARFRILAITSRSHQVNVARYIADHARRGAAVWACWQAPKP